MSNLELEVFRAGDYGEKGAYDSAALDTIAADYDPSLHEAPVTLDHAQAGPAHGWVAGLRRTGDRLVATLRGLSTQLLDLLGRGAFKKRSVELYPTFRETGRPYLRALSFLGAAVPEVKGLADAPAAPAQTDAPETEGGHSCPPCNPAPLFNDAAQQTVTFEDDLAGDDSEPTFTVIATEPSASSTPLPESADEYNENKEAPPAQPQRGETAVAQGNALGNEAATPEPCKGETAAAATFSEIIATLKQSGKWHPAWLERGIEHFYTALAQLPPVVAFAESLTPATWFTEFLAALPPAVTFEPVAAPHSAAHAASAATAQSALRFTETATGGPRIAPDSLRLHSAALALQTANPALTYTAALLQAAR